ncbi:MAG: cytochrome c-type biogenesis protein CcmH [Gammaproteobacteria bacterium]|jgi:cytochrome c-type biogenesis protein CcmH
MKRSVIYSFLLVFILSSLPVQARVSAYEFDTPEQEAAYKEMVSELRCLVCQNQNIADSNAELAQDLKRKTYEMVMQGKDKNEIADFMVQRYGDFVLYRPPLSNTTLLLWSGPFIIFVIGIIVLIRVIKSKQRDHSNQLTAEEKAKAEDMLK